jgi:transcriptional regulator with XRE-family HTH domain
MTEIVIGANMCSISTGRGSMKYTKNLGKILKEARQRAGYSQTQLVDRVKENLGLEGACGLSQATLSAWETGRQVPSEYKDAHVKEIACLLDLDLDILTQPYEDEEVIPLTAEALEMALSIMRALEFEVSPADLLLLVRVCQQIRGRVST